MDAHAGCITRPALLEIVMNKTARQSLPADNPGNRAGRTPTQADHGTREMPMPDAAPDVAGRSREGRVVSEPGDPGVIKPEDDVLDTSHLQNPGR